jgi:4a-hydroxytetrahydrobiopterin dehydratase
VTFAYNTVQINSPNRFSVFHTMPKLNPTDVQHALASLTGWSLDTDAPHTPPCLPSFDAAVARFNQIAQLAKDQDHHPEVLSSYTQLRVRIWTHDVSGLTDKDFKLAHSIDVLFAETPP